MTRIRRRLSAQGLLAGFLGLLLLGGAAGWGVSTAASFEAATDETFARYARHGADVWARNPGARIAGEGRTCISCHTSLPYALVEPLLPGDYPAYRDLLANIDNRIMTWSDNSPWYAEPKLEKMAALGGGGGGGGSRGPRKGAPSASGAGAGPGLYDF